MHRIRRVIEAGRIGRTRSFVVALVVAAMLLPAAEALAYFTSTGTGAVTGLAVSSAPSTVSIAKTTATNPVYAGPSTTGLAPGGTEDIQLTITCTAGAPCKGGPQGVVIQSWVSDKTGCDSTTLPNSFSSNTGGAIPNFNIAAVNGTATGDILITWANLAVSQNACLGATFTFTLAAA